MRNTANEWGVWKFSKDMGDFLRVLHSRIELEARCWKISASNGWIVRDPCSSRGQGNVDVPKYLKNKRRACRRWRTVKASYFTSPCWGYKSTVCLDFSNCVDVLNRAGLWNFWNLFTSTRQVNANGRPIGKLTMMQRMESGQFLYDRKLYVPRHSIPGILGFFDGLEICRYFKIHKSVLRPCMHHWRHRARNLKKYVEGCLRCQHDNDTTQNTNNSWNTDHLWMGMCMTFQNLTLVLERQRKYMTVSAHALTGYLGALFPTNQVQFSRGLMLPLPFSRTFRSTVDCMEALSLLFIARQIPDTGKAWWTKWSATEDVIESTPSSSYSIYDNWQNRGVLHWVLLFVGRKLLRHMLPAADATSISAVLP